MSTPTEYARLSGALYVSDLRALLADDGAALREHDDRTRVAEMRELVRVLESKPPGALPYTPESLARLLTMRADRIEGREVDADADA